MKSKISFVFFNGVLIMAAMLLTLFILDMLNPNMNFLDGNASKVFLVLFGIFSAGAGVCGISGNIASEDQQQQN